MGAPHFDVQVAHEDGRTIVRVIGEVDLAVVGEVEIAVRAHLGETPVVLDLAAVTFMDSSAMRLIDDLMRARGELRFRLPESEAGRHVLVLTGMLDQLPLA